MRIRRTNQIVLRIILSAAVAAPAFIHAEDITDTKAQNKDSKKTSGMQLGGLNSPDFNKLPTFIKSDSLALKQQERFFVYEGNVEVKHGDLMITSDRLEGSYNENNKIQKLTAKSNVLITKGESIRGTSELAVYLAEKETLTLTENPELTQNGSILSADAITVFLKEDRSEATGQVRVKLIDKKVGQSPLS